MGAVIFGFMYINQPSEEEIAAAKKAQTETIETGNQKSEEVIVDTLSTNQVINLTALVQTSGEAQKDGSYTFLANNINLRCDSTKLTGTVIVNNDTVNVENIIAQNLGEYGVLGLSVSSMNFGSIERTTVNSPEIGNNGTFRPSIMNVAVSYGKAFSTSIYAGATLKLLTESIDNVSSTAFAIDAGVQYVTGENYELKFGIALKNWGPSASFSGDGLSINTLPEFASHYMTTEQRSASYELPSSLNIGMSYDILFAENNYRITIAGNFASMAFGKDQYTLGLEYGFMKFFMLRAGYTYEEKLTTDIYDENGTTTLMNGLACGASVMAPLSKAKAGKNAMNLALDYSFRLTKIMGGIHSLGVSFSL